MQYQKGEQIMPTFVEILRW